MVHSPQFRDFMAGRYGVDPAHPFSVVPTAFSSAEMSNDPYRAQLGYRLGVAVPGQLAGRHLLGPVGNYLSSLGHDTLQAMLLGASFGALGGAGFGLGTGRKAIPAALAGTAVGGAGSAALSEVIRAWRAMGQPAAPQKQASAFGGDPLTLVRAALMADGAVDGGSKSELMRLLPQLDPAESAQLAGMLRTSAGVGVGILIARFLLRLGFVGTAISAMVGGYAASRMGEARNAYGLNTPTQTDLFGRARLIF